MSCKKTPIRNLVWEHLYCIGGFHTARELSLALNVKMPTLKRLLRKMQDLCQVSCLEGYGIDNDDIYFLTSMSEMPMTAKKVSMRLRVWKHFDYEDDVQTATALSRILNVKLSSLSSLLKKMCDAGELSRDEKYGPRGGYGYYILASSKMPKGYDE